MTSVWNAVVALYTSPIFAMLFAVLLLGEKMNTIKYISVILAMCGLVVIGYGKGLSLLNVDFIGMGAIVLSAVVWWYLKILLKTSLLTYDKMSMIFYQCFFWAIVFLPFIIFTDPLPTNFQIGLGWMYAFFIGIIWFFFYFSALNKIDVTVFSILQYFEMVAGILLAWIILWEPLTLPLVVGAVFIVVSGMALRFEGKNLIK
jgi:drug/metabolite transporter (DMT)-like permease